MDELDRNSLAKHEEGDSGGGGGASFEDQKGNPRKKLRRIRISA